MFRSKCNVCGETPYIFPDQIGFLQKNKFDPNTGAELIMHKYCKDKLKVGSDWFCVKCDASKKDGSQCKIIAELTGDKAKRLMDIRSRGANLEALGFSLPNYIKYGII